MLRKQVLREWKDFKKKFLEDRSLLEEVNSNLSYMTFSNSEDGTGIQASSYQVMEELRERLPSIVQKCRDLRNKYTSNQFGDANGESFATYLALIGLTATYQKIIEYYDDDSKARGPTIEEVD